MNISDGSGGQSQDFDINLAPIIDCFTVLITFLLASASFLAIGIFEANVAITGGSATPKKAPEVHLDIELHQNWEIHLRSASARGQEVKRISPIENSWNYSQLLSELDSLKAKWPGLDSATLTASDDVEYEQIILTMEKIRPKFPSVSLGGL